MTLAHSASFGRTPQVRKRKCPWHFTWKILINQLTVTSPCKLRAIKGFLNSTTGVTTSSKAFLSCTLSSTHRNLEPVLIHVFPLCLSSGIAAATMFMPEKMTEVSESQLRVAFDGDAVLFSDESERIFKAHGLDKFFEHERENEDTLLDHVCNLVHSWGNVLVSFNALIDDYRDILNMNSISFTHQSIRNSCRMTW